MLHDQISQNIEHLKQGKDIEKLPFAIEIIQVGKSKDNLEPTKINIQKQNLKENVKIEVTKAINKKPTSLIRKLFKWLSSPWSVHWRDL